VDNFPEEYLSKVLKNWAAECPLPARGRLRLLQTAALVPFSFFSFIRPRVALQFFNPIPWSQVNLSWDVPILMPIDLTWKRYIV